MRYVHFLNLDIVAGIFAGGVLVEHICNVSLPWSWWFLVPALTWVVYTLDRVLDDSRKQGEYPTLRHQFHHAYKRILVPACGLLVTAALIVGIWTPWWMWLIGLAATIVVALHHVVQHRLHSRSAGVMKDVNVVVTYVLVLWSVPLALVHDVSYMIVAGMTVHTALVMAMVVQLSLSDLEVDTRLSQPSIARSLGVGASKTLYRICVFTAVVGIVSIGISDTALSMTFAAICAGIAMMPRVFASSWPRPIARLYTEMLLSVPFLLLL